MKIHHGIETNYIVYKLDLTTGEIVGNFAQGLLWKKDPYFDLFNTSTAFRLDST